MDTDALVNEHLDHFYRSLKNPLSPYEEPDLMTFFEQRFAETIFGMSLHTIRPTFVRMYEILGKSGANSPEAKVDFGGYSAYLNVDAEDAEIETPGDSKAEIILETQSGIEYKIEIEPTSGYVDKNQSICLWKMDRSWPDHPYWYWFARGRAFQPDKKHDNPKIEMLIGGARVYGHSSPDRWATTFAFLDFARSIKMEGAKEPDTVGIANHMQAESSLAADGYIAGPVCKAAARAIRTETMKKIAPWAADRAIELEEIHREVGLNFGEAYFLHNDLDKYSFRVPTNDGRVILFHMNVSLINDNTSCLFVVDLDEAGKPTAITLKAFERQGISRDIISQLSEDGAELDNPNFRMDLRTGEFETSEEFDSANVSDFMAYGLGYDLERAKEYLLGDEREKWIRRDFEFLDPEKEFEEDIAPTP